MRPRLQLDFIIPRRRPRALGIAVLAGSLAVASVLVIEHNETRQRLHELDAAAALLSVPRPALAIPRDKLDGEMKNAQATVRQLALPWAQLIDSLERASMKDVALLNIQPDAQARVLRVTAEARREELMLQYLRRLSSTGNFAEVHLVSHQVREDDPQRPIQFSVQARFRNAL
ncbi:MAG TPA: PilN domain-containing protein [Burkholderiales bacterium]|nr:PilN domain-containing protein [Burkholderiales bacterium]